VQAPRFLRISPRNAEFGVLQDTFLVAAVTTILVIRTQLWLTNYPQLGGAGLHIAHLLYGGAFMVLAIGILITFLGRAPRRPAAIIGGVGFGFFIDELGKFITADNDYFFQPAPALIYLIFVGLFLLTRHLQQKGGLTPSERLANAIDLLSAAARQDVDVRDRGRALELLDGADPSDPLVEPVREIVSAIDAAPARPPSRAGRMAASLRARYLHVIEQDWFRPVVGWIFAAWALLSIASVVAFVLSLGLHVGGAERGFASDAVDRLRFVNVATLVSATVSAVLVVIGLRRLLHGDRLGAYRMFERALLVAILVTRVLVFVESQFGAVFGLAVDLLLLVTVHYMTEEERRLGGAGSPAGEVRRGSSTSVAIPAAAASDAATSMAARKPET
jgi:hypothetical protein